ncbi:NAD-specific glutamate dehydrogenase, large form, partial [hydrothermal vent metagenome]
MTGLDGGDTPNVSVVERLIASIPSDLPPERRAMLATFSGMYLKRLPDVEVPDLPIKQLLAEISHLLDFVDAREPGSPAIRVFNPNEECCGYSAPGTVVQVVSDDGPFLVDSITAVVARSGAGVVRHLHPVVGTVRGTDGRLVEITKARGADRRESIQHFELDRILPDEAARGVEEEISRVLADVAVTVGDFSAMRGAVEEMIKTAKSSTHHYPYEEVAETVDFLTWLLDDNFVLLGYRRYDIVESDEGPSVQPNVSTGLGLLSRGDNGNGVGPVLLSDLPPNLRERYLGGDLLVITKTNRHATVHRDARMDYVGMRQIDESGTMIAELRLIGLFTSKAYIAPAREIPVLRRKLQQVLEIQDVIEGSHDYKSIIQLFETFPKDDLFAMPVDALSEMLGDLVETEDTRSVRLFVRRDVLQRFVSVLVTVPRDRFNVNLRRQLQSLFLERFGGSTVDYRLSLGESGDARIHFSVWTQPGAPLIVDLQQLENEVVALARNWDDRVLDELEPHVGEAEARRLRDEWTDDFPEYYRASTAIDLVAGDIIALDRLASSDNDLIVDLQNEGSGIKAPIAHEKLTRITVYRKSGKLNLSIVMPLMEHLGLIVVEEVPTRLKDAGETFIHDFGVLT